MINIIFQNQHWAIIDKPAGQLSVPGRFKDDPRPVTGKLLEQQLGQQVYPVHRLDEEVSGLLIFALTPHDHRVANRWFEQDLIKKFYLALSAGPMPDWKEARWESMLMRGKKRAYEADYGKKAITEAVYLGADQNGHHQFRLYPVTGRSHQLRYEMSKHGYPILGDELYGQTIPYKPNEIALRCYELNLSKIKIEERAGIPEVLKINQN